MSSILQYEDKLCKRSFFQKSWNTNLAHLIILFHLFLGICFPSCGSLFAAKFAVSIGHKKLTVFGVRFLQFTKQLTLKLIYYNVLHNKAIMWVRSFLYLIRLLIFHTAIDYFTSRPYTIVRKSMLYKKQLHPEIFYYSMLIIFGRPNARSLALPRLEFRVLPSSCPVFFLYCPLFLFLSVFSCPVLKYTLLFCRVLSLLSCLALSFPVISVYCLVLSLYGTSFVPIIFSCFV